MSFHNDICPTVEAALVAYIKAQAPANIVAASVYPGMGWGNNSEDALDQDQPKRSTPLPNVICDCQDAELWVAPGNWEATATIQVRSNADDTTREVHRLRAGEIFSYFFIGSPGEYVTLADAISAELEDFTAQIAVPGTPRTTRVDRSWVSELKIVLKCCGSDLG